MVEAHLYAGLNHGETVNKSLKESVPFVRKILAGEPVRSICEPVAEQTYSATVSASYSYSQS